MRRLNLALIAIAFVVYAATFGRNGIRAVFFFMPWTMTPFAVIAYLAWRWRSLGAQITLLLALLGYAAWFMYVYVDAMIINLDPQSPIAFLFVAVYALPILIALWLVAYAFEWRLPAA